MIITGVIKRRRGAITFFLSVIIFGGTFWVSRISFLSSLVAWPLYYSILNCDVDWKIDIIPSPPEELTHLRIKFQNDIIDVVIRMIFSFVIFNNNNNKMLLHIMREVRCTLIFNRPFAQTSPRPNVRRDLWVSECKNKMFKRYLICKGTAENNNT